MTIGNRAPIGTRKRPATTLRPILPDPWRRGRRPPIAHRTAPLHAIALSAELVTEKRVMRSVVPAERWKVMAR